MPGIIGVVSGEGTEQHRSDLERMIRPLQRSIGLCVERASGEYFALGTVTLPAACQGIAQRENVWLALFGMLVEGSGFPPPSEHNANGRMPKTMAQVLLDRYFSGGLRALQDLNGLFSLAIWEEDARRLTLMRCRHGYNNLYYWHSPERLMFASEYKAISWHPSFNKALNPVAIADQMIYRLNAAGRTPFADIQAMPPAGVLIYQDGRVQTDVYWKPTYYAAGQKEKRDVEYADDLAELMRQSIRRRVQPDTCMLITGGLDSRVVAGMYQAVSPDVPLVTSTVGMPHGMDALLGREVAQVLGYPHHHVPLGEDYLARYAADCTWITEGKNSAYASWILAQIPFQQQRRLPFVMAGLFGNFISGRHYPPALGKARTFEEGLAVAESTLQPYLRETAEVMRPEVFQSAGQESLRFTRDLFRDAPVSNPYQRFDHMLYYMRIAWAGQTADSLGDAALAIEPFLDNDVMDFAFTYVPPAVRARALFYHQMIVHHLPKVAAVPYGRAGYSVNTDLLINQHTALAWLEDKRRRALKRLFPHKYGEARSCVPHAAAIRRGSRQYVEAILSRGDYLEDFFDMRAVRSMLNDHLTRRRNAFMTLDSLLTIALWREQFVELDGPISEQLPLPNALNVVAYAD